MVSAQAAAAVRVQGKNFHGTIDAACVGKVCLATCSEARCPTGATCHLITRVCYIPDEGCGDDVCGYFETGKNCPADCDCGNDVIDPGEQCDGDDLQGFDCKALGLPGPGPLKCDPEGCVFDTEDCMPTT